MLDHSFIFDYTVIVKKVVVLIKRLERCGVSRVSLYIRFARVVLYTARTFSPFLHAHSSVKITQRFYTKGYKCILEYKAVLLSKS
jgi:hypothetical protein